MPVIELLTVIKAPIEICFDLSRSIDLHKISTAQTNEKAIAGITNGLIGPGDFVTWQAKHFGLRLQLTTMITGYNRPAFFRDEEVKGAFSSFKHDHSFEALEGETIMKDVFDFKSPFGFIGKIFNALLLTRYMESLLKTRNQTIKVYAENGEGQLMLEKL
jgi:ligand-binding SRPBCC domain-containing protein